MLFISDVQCYVLIKLCKTAGSIHLFKITGILVPGRVTINKHYIWNILEVGWKYVKVTFNPFVTAVDPPVHTDSFLDICQYCSKCFFSHFINV